MYIVCSFGLPINLIHSHRSKIFAKCKDLKSKSKIKDVTTKNGDIIVLVDVRQKMTDSPCEDEDEGGNGQYVEKAVARVVERSSDSESPISPPLSSGERDSPATVTQKLVVVTDEAFSNLLKITKGLGDEDDIADMEKAEE